MTSKYPFSLVMLMYDRLDKPAAAFSSDSDGAVRLLRQLLAYEQGAKAAMDRVKGYGGFTPASSEEGAAKRERQIGADTELFKQQRKERCQAVDEFATRPQHLRCEYGGQSCSRSYCISYCSFVSI